MTLDEAEALAAGGKLAEHLIPLDAPIGHMPKVDVPASLHKRVVNGAKLPILSGTPEEGKPVRVYAQGAFWGIAVREDKELWWRALLAPEGEETHP